jgi:hypothetical protein
MISLLGLSCFLYLIIGFKLFLHTPTPELSSRPRWLISHSTGLELLPSQRHGDGHSRLGVPGHRRGLLIFCYWWCWPFCYSFRALFPAFGVSSAGPADRRPVKELSVTHLFFTSSEQDKFGSINSPLIRAHGGRGQILGFWRCRQSNLAWLVPIRF